MRTAEAEFRLDLTRLPATIKSLKGEFLHVLHMFSCQYVTVGLVAHNDQRWTLTRDE